MASTKKTLAAAKKYQATYQEKVVRDRLDEDKPGGEGPTLYANVHCLRWKHDPDGPRFLIDDLWLTRSRTSARGYPREDVFSVAGDFDLDGRDFILTKVARALQERTGTSRYVQRVGPRDLFLAARVEVELELADHTVARELGLDPESTTPDEVYRLTGEYPHAHAALRYVDAFVPIDAPHVTGDVIRLLDDGWKILRLVDEANSGNITSEHDRQRFCAAFGVDPMSLAETARYDAATFAAKLAEWRASNSPFEFFWNDPPRSPADRGVSIAEAIGMHRAKMDQEAAERALLPEDDA